MSAYIVVRVGEIVDRERYEAYRSRTPALLAAHGASYIVKGADEHLAEGDGAERLTIIRFPSMAALERFWNSPEYDEVRRLRLGAVDLKIGFVDGVPDTQPPGATMHPNPQEKP